MDTPTKAYAVDAAMDERGLSAIGIVSLDGRGARYQVHITDLLSPTQRARRAAGVAELCGVLVVIARHYKTPLVVRTDSQGTVVNFEKLCQGAAVRCLRDATPEVLALAELARRAAGEYSISVKWKRRSTSRQRLADSVSHGKRLQGSSPRSVWRYLAASPAIETPELLPVLVDRYGFLPLPRSVVAIRRQMHRDDPLLPKPAPRAAVHRTCI